VSLLPDHPRPNLPLLERLNVYDGLMMNARRWDLAEDYHRQRQGYIHQAITQPGIVFGLGVCLVQPDDEMDSQYKTGLWVEIQPGLAIDQAGNPIVVDEATDRRYLVDVAFLSSQAETIYIVILHEPPYKSVQHKQEKLREWFKLEQLRYLPNDGQRIELCRIKLQATGQAKPHLQEPENVFNPGINELDLRFRLPAYLRYQSSAKIAQLAFPNQSASTNAQSQKLDLHNLKFLATSLPGLYPALSIQVENDVVAIDTELSMYAMGFIPDGTKILQISDEDYRQLKDYLDCGGGLLVESDSDSTTLTSLLKELEMLSDHPLIKWNSLAQEESLRYCPFLFGALPELPGQLIQVYVGNGVVLIDGQLSKAWGLTTIKPLPRTNIREAQEFGINLLHFFSQRWQMRQLMKQYPIDDSSQA
jgi:hypothetical protein